ncbi:NAD(P)/FAD-dependent oxidoreductase [Phenylobacterium terrae]|uniref:NAD(P)/FAD-dependent oxidoreductase n=1 Tax=Phenylobacterium terrae TaxID=2665495 RepID=A0ABW4MZE5_9CAUL
MGDAAGHVVILGAGHAGGTAAALLRQYGYEGHITLVGEEPIPPYQRPPLSKAWLKGEANADDLTLKPVEFYAESKIDFRPNLKGVQIDRKDRRVTLSDGSVITYDTLILATGARPIALPLPGADLEGVLFLRTAADAEALKAQVGPGKRLAVVGGGYIGLEVAASGRALGAEVVVLERENRLLARVACEALSDFFKGYHETKGVAFELGCSVTGFVGDAGHITGVLLESGRIVPCDAAVVGVGVRPNDEIAREARLEVGRGVIVDLDARTSDPAIFAIGDVTERPMAHYDNRMFRPESVPSALEQSKQAAAAICGRPRPAPEVPWNWSDQYDLKLQIAGLPFDADDLLIRGDPSTGRFAVFHLKGDIVQSVESINSPPEFMMGKQLIGSKKPVSRAKLADPTISMKEVAV